MGLITVLLILVLLAYVFFEIDPKIDHNTETGHYLLWFNDPFDQKSRKAIPLWRAKIEK
jgi:hypothetical protein